MNILSYANIQKVSIFQVSSHFPYMARALDAQEGWEGTTSMWNCWHETRRAGSSGTYHFYDKILAVACTVIYFLPTKIMI